MYNWRFRTLLPPVMVAIAATACLQRQVKPEKYEKDGLSFTHFSNWKIESDKLIGDANARIITIEGPENAVLTLTRFSPENPISLEQYAQILEEERTASIKEQYGGILNTDKSKTKSTVMMIAGESQTGLTQAFSIRLLGVNVPHIANFFMIQGGGNKWILMAQAPSEDWTKVQSGFQKIFDSVAFAPNGAHGK